MKKLFIISIYLVFVVEVFYCQHQGDIWYFGQGAGLDFVVVFLLL